ncbi:MAG TPA: mannosyltransferase family protein [Gaiellaceae bacterium]|nr:mannosyltransferase family protein [Gaiellaceae bacterium]
MSGGQTLQERRVGGVGPPAPAAARSPVLGIWLWSRAAIWAAALFAFYTFQPNRNPLVNLHNWDDPKLTHDLGAFTDVWARWDSVWFLRIAEHGYTSSSHADTAFYPLYPAAISGLGHVFFGHYLVAGLVISLLASLGAFFLLHRLAEERLGADGARRSVLYLALFPMSLFLIAVYSESLFLLLALAAFVLAERGRWLPAWAAAGLAVVTRVAGFALLPALALMAWRSPDRKRALAGVAIPAVLFSGYPIYLAVARGDGWAFLHSQGLWHRHFSYAGPLGGIWEGLRSGWAGIEQLASGSHTHNYWPAVSIQDSDPMRTAFINLSALVFLALFIWLSIVAWRRFGAVYGVYCLVGLAIPLSAPSSRWPLLSMPRFGLALFPIFLALAVVGGRPRAHTAILAVSAVVLGVAVSQWAVWQWVA